MTSVQPPSPPQQAASTQAASTPVEGEVVAADVVKLPTTLEKNDRALILRGEVTANNADGSVRIATPRGPIDVQLPQGQTATRGQTVEVQIPAGDPPKTVALTLPQQQPAQTPQPQAPQTNTPAPQAQPPLPITDDVSIPLPTNTQNAPSTTRPTPQIPPLTQPAAQTPAQTPSQNTQAATPAPQQPQVQLPESNISPQKLMAFLKSSLETFLKAPDIAPNANAAQPQQAFTQRPFILGQLARLTPMIGQPITAQPTSIAMPQTQMPALAGNLQSGLLDAKQQTGMSLLLTPGTPQTPATQASTQSIIQNVLGNSTQIGPVIANSNIVTPDAPIRVLLPLQPITSQAPSPSTPIQNLALVTPQTTLALPTAQVPTTTLTTPTQSIPVLNVSDIRITSVLPTAPLAQVQNAAIATQLHGTPATPVMFATLAGQTAHGLPVLEMPMFTLTPDGAAKTTPTMMVLQYPASTTSPQTVIGFEVLPQVQASGTIATAPLSPFATLPTVNWDGLDDAIKMLHADPQTQMAAQNLQAALPKPGGTAFTAPVMMMAAAMRQGDVMQWIGEKAIDALKVSKGRDALAKITSDFASSARDMNDAPKAEWRSLTLPMVYGQEIHRIQLAYRKFERDDADGKLDQKSGTRFVMDLALSRMGPMQIDGYSVEKRLDITLRTERALSPAMREMIRTRYAGALTGIGFAGQLNFNATPDKKGWVAFDHPSDIHASASV